MIGGGRVVDASDDFARWVEPHLPTLRRYAARLVGPADREDVVQEALVRAWRRHATYDPSRGAPLPWLLAIVADRARRQRRGARYHLELTETDRVGELTLADLDLERALSRLSKRQRMAVDLYYFVDLDVDTTAAVMGCAPGTVRATLHQARATLRQLLGEDDD